MAEAGHPAGQGSPSIEMELDGQAERPSLGTSSASSTVSYYKSISDELDANSAPFQLVQNRKRRKASTSSESSDKTDKTMNRTDLHLTMIVRPRDPDKVIATITPKKIQEKLDMTAPDGVILVRPNQRLNVLAIDTRNRDATKALLALTTLDGIAVLAYEPLPRESVAGVMYEVPADLTEVELQLAVRTTAPVISIRRLVAYTNSYLHKIGKAQSPECASCGGVHNIQHVVCECEEYSHERQSMKKQLNIKEEEQISIDIVFGPWMTSSDGYKATKLS
ncbi:hypothetical protein HPB47_025001 [Ixodes persulcatus]|uniref:Uncharacterized protein n=1 Tax=Ixodes persulcatus TaxID=34615 RepID=A0AC60Q2N9_IXOPE|nr:hypothetical protein HPB47_025001 [Ixodes persulcatus]